MARYLIKKQITGVGLPAGYKRLEYIEATNNQYINTGIKLASTDVVMTKFQNVSTTGGLYGVYKLGESSTFYSSGTYYFYDGTNTRINTGVSVNTDWHEVVHDFVNGKLTFDGTDHTFTPWTFENTSNSPLFARIYNGNAGYFFNGRIAYWKVYRNGTLIMDLVPCINTNNEVGMYDTVAGVFHGSRSASSFTAGPEVTEIRRYCVAFYGIRFVIHKEV